MSRVKPQVLFLPMLLALKLLIAGLSGGIWEDMTGSMMRQTRVHKMITAMGYCLANREDELLAVFCSKGTETDRGEVYAVFETKPGPVWEEP